VNINKNPRGKSNVLENVLVCGADVNPDTIGINSLKIECLGGTISSDRAISCRLVWTWRSIDLAS
jgi:hypothetical protein